MPVVTEGFTAFRKQAVAGLPRNLGVLHSRLLTPIAIRYWARTMRSTIGELCFAARARHAEAEMRPLGSDVLAHIGKEDAKASLQDLFGEA